MRMTSVSQPASRSGTVAGIGFMLAGVFLFSLSDAVAKWLVASYSVGQMMLVRSAAMLILLGPFIWRAGRLAFVRAPRPFLQVVRVAFSALEVAMFFWAVAYLPLADAVTFYLAGPIYVTAIAALFLREPVGWRRWSAVLVGFAGVIIALRPSAAMFTLPALIALAGSVFYALLMVTTRVLRETDDTVMIATQYAGSLLLGAVMAPFAWVPLAAYDLTLLAGFGVLSLAALFCVNRSLKLAPASVVVPYQYTLIVWAGLLGWWGFGEVPDMYTLAGGTIIVAAGLYIFRREHGVMRREPVPVQPPV